jgi:glycosyltransferase involved in cell wall biosynthesis
MTPRISVVTPSFNQVAFLERTLTSVLDQGYPDLEYLVMDGGSTDGSVEVIRRYADRLTYWTSGPDGGQADAVNRGWQRSTGDVLGWINSDDFYLPGTLAFVAEFLDAHPEVDVLYGRCQVIGADGHPIGLVGEPFDRRTMFLRRDQIPQPSTFIRRAALDRVGQIDVGLRYSLDYDLFLRLCRDRQPAFVDRPLAGFTVHADAKTTRDRSASRRESYAVRLRYAGWPDRALLLGAMAASRLLHAMPSRVLRVVDRARSIRTD